MKGDFSRQTFDPNQHFLRVLLQQGRVQLDADWNEQVAILLHYLQTLAADLIGPFGGPQDILEPGNAPYVLQQKCGIEIITQPERLDELRELDRDTAKRDRLKALLAEPNTRFLIGKGHYYVNGVLCENPDYVAYNDQPDHPGAPAPPTSEPYLVYLDVWERHITPVEEPDLRETALNGPDTASSSKIVCQVKFAIPSPKGAASGASRIVATEDQVSTCDEVKRIWENLVDQWQPALRGRLRARARPSTTPATEACTISPEAQYRGAENQLYRVEVHKGTTGTSVQGNVHLGTFKWSRENGTVVFPIIALHEATSNALTLTTVTVAHLGRDGRFGLAPGDWVEMVDDDYVLQERAAPLLQVQAIDRANLQVTLAGVSDAAIDPAKHALLRRWDQKEGNLARGGLRLEDGTIPIIEGAGEVNWLTLEDGVEVQFQTGQKHRSGDYWLIPARTITGDVEWPQVPDPDDEEKQLPAPVPPHGVTHYYAPLAVIRAPQDFDDCRCAFEPLPCVPSDGEGLLFDRQEVALPVAPERKPEPELEIRPPAKAKPASKPKARGES